MNVTEVLVAGERVAGDAPAGVSRAFFEDEPATTIFIERVCLACGCTDSAACAGGCRWIRPDVDICSTCWTRLAPTEAGAGRRGSQQGQTFRELAEASRTRRDRWHGPDTEPWTGADWSNAMCGEAGEAANVVKKIRRHETGTAGSEDSSPSQLRHKLADELGDVIAYATLLADHYDLDLGTAVADKFNRVSARHGFPERIGPGSQQEAGDA